MMKAADVARATRVGKPWEFNGTILQSFEIPDANYPGGIRYTEKQTRGGHSVWVDAVAYDGD